MESRSGRRWVSSEYWKGNGQGQGQNKSYEWVWEMDVCAIENYINMGSQRGSHVLLWCFWLGDGVIWMTPEDLQGKNAIFIFENVLFLADLGTCWWKQWLNQEAVANGVVVNISNHMHIHTWELDNIFINIKHIPHCINTSKTCSAF